MENHIDFEEKAKSLTAKEIILLMIDSVKNPVIKLDLDTFGKVDADGICVGCAATNAVCKLADVVFDQESVGWTFRRAGKVHAEARFVERFEYAIDYLRCGDITGYNSFAVQIGIAQIKEKDELILNPIENHTIEKGYLDDVLLAYYELAEYQTV